MAEWRSIVCAGQRKTCPRREMSARKLRADTLLWPMVHAAPREISHPCNSSRPRDRERPHSHSRNRRNRSRYIHSPDQFHKSHRCRLRNRSWPRLPRPPPSFPSMPGSMHSACPPERYSAVSTCHLSPLVVVTASTCLNWLTRQDSKSKNVNLTGDFVA
jgi:hypothetical protein